MLDTSGQKIRDENGLPASSGSSDERRTRGRQPPLGNDVEARNSGCYLLDAVVFVASGHALAVLVGEQRECDEHLLGIGEISGDTSARLRRSLHERRSGENAFFLGALGILLHVDNGQLVVTAQSVLSDATQIRDRTLRPR